jgi:hypothetical protein
MVASEEAFDTMELVMVDYIKYKFEIEGIPQWNRGFATFSGECFLRY